MAVDPLSSISAALAESVARVAPSVVRVEGRRRPSSGIAFTADTIITSAGTLEQDEIEVGLHDGRTLPAELIGRDAATDVALLRVKDAGLPPAHFIDGAAGAGLQAGNLIFSVSRPGKSARAALGVLSAVSEGEWRSPGGARLERYLESDLTPRPGFSGSALVDASGRLIGMNTAGLMRGSASIIPAIALQRIAQSLLAHGGIPRGYLGVSSFPARLPDELAKKLGQPAALLVAGVDPEGPAAKAGLLLGDVLVSLAGQALAHPGELLELLDEASVGRVMPLRTLRAGEIRDTSITVGKREARA